MKLKKVKIVNRGVKSTIFEVTYTNMWGKEITRKAYKEKPYSLCYWLDNGGIIYGMSDSLCAILDNGGRFDEFIV